MKTANRLKGVRRVFLDTAPVIYALENDATFGRLTWEFLLACFESQIQVVASAITLAESIAGTEDPNLLRRFVEFLTGTEIQFEGITDIDALQAGVMRRQSKLTLTDCLQLACATRTRCDLFLTNDAGLRSAATSFEVVCVSELRA